MEVHLHLLQLMAILIAARLFAEIGSKLGIPPVVGEMTAGVVLGPSLLGWVSPNEVLGILAEIGIILLLFKVGLETDVRQLVRTGVSALVVAVVGFAAPFVLGFGIAHGVLRLDVMPSLFVGGTLTATSIGITVRVLRDLGRQDSREGKIVLGAAVLDDIFGVILLATLHEFSTGGGVGLVNAGKVALFILIFLALATPVAKLMGWIIHKIDSVSEISGLVPTMVVSLVLFFAWLAHAVGAPELLGGFAAGLALSRRFFLPLGLAIRKPPGLARRTEDHMTPIVHLFTPIFFVTVGLSLDLSAVSWGSPFIWIFALVMTAAAVAGKMVSPLGLRQENPRTRTAIGLAMVPRGEVGLIFVELGRVSGMFDGALHAGMIMVIVLTTLLPPFAMKAFYGRWGEDMPKEHFKGAGGKPGLNTP